MSELKQYCWNVERQKSLNNGFNYLCWYISGFNWYNLCTSLPMNQQWLAMKKETDHIGWKYEKNESLEN